MLRTCSCSCTSDSDSKPANLTNCRGANHAVISRRVDASRSHETTSVQTAGETNSWPTRICSDSLRCWRQCAAHCNTQSWRHPLSCIMQWSQLRRDCNHCFTAMGRVRQPASCCAGDNTSHPHSSACQLVIILQLTLLAYVTFRKVMQRRPSGEMGVSVGI